MDKKRRVVFALHFERSQVRKVLPGLLGFARKSGWEVHCENTRDIRFLRERQKALEHWGAEGLIVSPLTPVNVKELREWGMPVVGIWGDAASASAAGIPVVQDGDWDIGRLAARHLWERGYRHFSGMGVTAVPWSTQRLAGFAAYLREQGIEDVALFRLPHTNLSTKHWAKWHPRTRDWLQRLPKPVGLFAASDWLGQNALELCVENGLSVPYQVAVVGVDDDVALCELLRPTLTSIRLDLAATGYRAAKLLAAAMDGQRPIPAEIVVVPPVGVIPRQSTDSVAVSDPVMARVLRLITENAERPFNVTDILRAIPISRRTLERKTIKVLGHSPLDEIHRIKTERAKDLLAHTDLTDKEIAARLGLNGPKHLRRVFHKTIGVLPSAYRRDAASRSAMDSISVPHGDRPDR